MILVTMEGYQRRECHAIPEPSVLVHAALVGFDRREAVTIPPLGDAALGDALDAARQAVLPGFRQSQPAERHRAAR